MKISVIIPVLNESAIIANTLTRIKENSSSRHIEEILVVDGGSEDRTVEIALKPG